MAASRQRDFAEFLRRFPDYESRRLDDLRAGDYERIDRLGHVYLDYTGGSLYGCIDPKSSGAVRVSLGIASNFADVHAFVEFARAFSAAEPGREAALAAASYAG